MKDFKTLFPRASQSFVAANQHLEDEQESGLPNECHGRISPVVQSRRGRMNKTEREYSFFLEAQKLAGEILDYKFEGITLRWNGIRYTPDFVVFCRSYIKFIEIKGAFTKGKFERAVERFRHAQTYWTLFSFELHQRQKGGTWRRIM